MITEEHLTTLQTLYVSWSGNATAPSNLERLVNIADALFRELNPNVPLYEDMTDNCKLAYDKALIEQVMFYEEYGTNSNTRQLVTAIKAGDASENYSTPQGIEKKICDEANSFLDNAECGFKSRRTQGIHNGRNCDCGCDENEI